MPSVAIPTHFDKVYRIVSHPRFLERKGLGNEVPFFVDTYDPADEFAVADQVRLLHDRLQHEGIPTVLLPMYDIVLDMLKDLGWLQKLFDMEANMPKTADAGGRRARTFFTEMDKFTDVRAGSRLHSEIDRRIEEVSGHRLVLMHQLGTVFPFLRTHTLLNNLHSLITRVPLVAFFPGQYVSSDREGFYLSLFGRFNGDYYRAFQLEDYLDRGQIRADVE